MDESPQSLADIISKIESRFDRLEERIAYRPGWITGAVNLGRHLGFKDQKGRKARAWAEIEGIPCKIINGTPSWSLSDVDRAMRNGKKIELPKPDKNWAA